MRVHGRLYETLLLLHRVLFCGIELETWTWRWKTIRGQGRRSPRLLRSYTGNDSVRLHIRHLHVRTHTHAHTHTLLIPNTTPDFLFRSQVCISILPWLNAEVENSQKSSPPLSRPVWGWSATQTSGMVSHLFCTIWWTVHGGTGSALDLPKLQKLPSLPQGEGVKEFCLVG